MAEKENLAALTTEGRNPNTLNIDAVSTLEMLQMINAEDAKAAEAVRRELPNIAKAVDYVAEVIRNGGRLFYAGAGTSGRIGVLDASEIPPTFGVSPDVIQAIIAGGKDAMFAAIEGAEDDEQSGWADVSARVTEKDAVCGISASGRTPYVLGALKRAGQLGALTIGISNSAGSLVQAAASIAITPVAGAEALTGSTRMKAGTMQKMVVNMLSTGVMIRLGKTYGNLMVDVVPTNRKLVDRAARIVAEAAGCAYELALKTLEQAGNNPKTAVVMLKTGKDAAISAELLAQNNGFITRAINAE